MTKTRAAVATAAVIVATAAIVPTVILTSEGGGTDCTLANRADWQGSDCNYGTLIQLTGKSWTCNRNLALYGTLPIRVEIREGTTTPAQWTGANAGKIILSNGCTQPAADYAAGKVDLIGWTDGQGPKVDPYGNGQDALKYNGSVGPHDLIWTVEAQCGKIAPQAHQDGLQMQAGNHVTLVNGTIGNWDDGLATCAGAGGSVFYSSANGHFPGPEVNIVGGQYMTCGKGLYGGNDTAHGGGYPIGATTGAVTDAGFRTGRGSDDPNCAGIGATKPCQSGNTVVRVNLTCEHWSHLEQRWVP